MCMFIWSDQLLWRHIVYWLSVVIQATTECYSYTVGISMTGDSKNVEARPSVCNARKYAYSSCSVYKRIIIRISGEKTWLSLQENKAIFSKKLVLKDFTEIAYYSCILNNRTIFGMSGKKYTNMYKRIQRFEYVGLLSLLAFNIYKRKFDLLKIWRLYCI